ncbi:MAG: DNA-directed RNA polymerases I, II, and III subunit RPABC3 [Paramarteilia canceri]
MSFLCDIHKDIFKTDIGDSIQIKIANNLSDESKPPERTFMDVKSALDGPSLADSFPYIMNGRIYEISYPNELLQYDESKSDIGKFSKGETVFTCMKKVAY